MLKIDRGKACSDTHCDVYHCGCDGRQPCVLVVNQFTYIVSDIGSKHMNFSLRKQSAWTQLMGVKSAISRLLMTL